MEEQQQPAKFIVVPTELAQTVVNYLTTKPYSEVHQLVQALISCPPLPMQSTPGRPLPIPTPMGAPPVKIEEAAAEAQPE